MPQLPAEIWTIIGKEAQWDWEQSNDSVGKTPLCVLARVSLDLNAVASELLYRHVKTNSIERLFEGVDVVGNEAGKDISRHPKKHWLAKIEEIRLTIDTWTPTRGPALEAILGSVTTAHTDRLAEVLPSMKRLIISEQFQAIPRPERSSPVVPPTTVIYAVNEPGRPVWHVMDLPYISLCTFGCPGHHNRTLEPPQPLRSTTQNYTRHFHSCSYHNFQLTVVDGTPTYRFIPHHYLTSTGCHEPFTDNFMDREAPRFHWQIGGLLKDWQKSGISSIDIKKVRFELYGVHHVKFFPKSGITTREEETECMTRFNARMSEKPYQMDGVGPVWIKYFSREEAPPCQGCEKSSERRVIEHGPGEEEDEGTGSGEGESDEESDREDYEDEESEEDEEEESDDEKDKEDYEDEESEEDDGESAGSDQPSQ